MYRFRIRLVQATDLTNFVEEKPQITTILQSGLYIHDDDSNTVVTVLMADC